MPNSFISVTKDNLLVIDDETLYQQELEYSQDSLLGSQVEPTEILIPVAIPTQNIIKLLVRRYHFYVLTKDGLFTWGENSFGTAGHGHDMPISTPQKVEGIEDIIDIAAGDGHAIILTIRGNAYVTGVNSYGQQGGNKDSSFENLFFTPLTIPNHPNKKIKQIFAGDYSTLVTDEDNILWACGKKEIRELIHSKSRDYVFRLTQLQLPEPFLVKNICSTWSTTFLLTTKGELYRCGRKGSKKLTSGFERIELPNSVLDIQSNPNQLLMRDSQGDAWVISDIEYSSIIDNTSSCQPLKINTVSNVKLIKIGEHNFYFLYEEENTAGKKVLNFLNLGNKTFYDDKVCSALKATYYKNNLEQQGNIKSGIRFFSDITVRSSEDGPENSVVSLNSHHSI